MEKLHQFFAVSITAMLLLCNVSINAQTNKSNNSLQQSVKDLGNIFKKKNKDSVTSTTSGNSNTPINPNSGLQAGSISSNAKYLDADQLGNFNYGTAIIRKGTSTALMDANGNIIVPYNSYDILAYTVGSKGYTHYFNGFNAYNNTNHQWGGYINAAGKIIAKNDVNNMYRTTEDNRLIWISKNNGKNVYTTTYIVPDGRAFSTSEPLQDIVDGIGLVRSKPDAYGTRKYWGYQKINGDMLTAAEFDEAYAFSDGMACVGKKNQFGEIKYGFIDKQGKLAIPFNFSIKPNSFSGSYAKVQPKDKTEFEYAFINKSGEIVFKQTLADIAKNGTFDHFTNYGLAFSNGHYLMDSTFKLIPKKDFFQSFGIPADSWFIEENNYIEGEKNPKLVFSTRTAIGQFTKMPIVGFINLATKKVVMPAFDLINLQSIYFDPLSHLAYAKVCIGKQPQGGLIYREGYINEDGQFVFVKGEGSKW